LSNSDINGIGIAPVARDYHGPCPVMLHFKATIYLTRAPIKIRYYWERNGHIKTTTQLVEVAANSSTKLNIEDNWAFGGPGKPFNASDRLHVLTKAGEVLSDVVDSSGRCKP